MKEYHKIQSIFKRDERGRFTSDYSMPEFEYLKDCEWIGTEKVDGTNIRVMWDGENVKFGGKTDNAQIYVKLYERLVEIFKIDLMKEHFKEPVCLYGEGYGARIQKGGGNYISDGVDFVLFDIKCGDWWLKRESLELISNNLEIKIVPIVFRGNLFQAIQKVETGFNSQWGPFEAEGLVLKPKIELFNRKKERIITKVKTKDFK